MTELTYAALRQIMYQPSAVWLATENSGDRWLHDQWVMLNVTGHEALALPDFSGDLPDGAYKLMADSDKGLQPRESIPPADVEAWFAGVADLTWTPAFPTQWSVAEHPGKAMLWHADGDPCLVGESTWTAIKRHYPDCLVEWAPERNLFKFGYPDWFCFAAGIQIPDGEYSNAFDISSREHLTQLATASSLEGESTSNEE